MSEHLSIGNPVKSWKDLQAVHLQAQIQKIFVRWPNAWKLCTVVEVLPSSVLVDTENGGRMEVKSPKALRYARANYMGGGE